MDTLAKARGSIARRRYSAGRISCPPKRRWPWRCRRCGGFAPPPAPAALRRCGPRRSHHLERHCDPDRGGLLRDVPGASGRRRHGPGSRSFWRCSCCCSPGSPFRSCRRWPASACCCSGRSDDSASTPRRRCPAIRSRTAMLLPTYNEDPHRVLARLRAIYESVEETGHGAQFRLVRAERHHRSGDLDRRGEVLSRSSDSEVGTPTGSSTATAPRTPRASPAISRNGSSGSAPTMNACSSSTPTA